MAGIQRLFWQKFIHAPVRVTLARFDEARAAHRQALAQISAPNRIKQEIITQFFVYGAAYSMQDNTPSKPALLAGRILTGFTIAFLLFDVVVKILQRPEAVEPTAALGFSAGSVLTIGLIELICLALYVFPRTAVLGAVLMTGFLGGAFAINMRAGMPIFNQVFPFIIGALMWGGLYLRERRLGALLPLR